jgi:hypothetical protein
VESDNFSASNTASCRLIHEGLPSTGLNEPQYFFLLLHKRKSILKKKQLTTHVCSAADKKTTNLNLLWFLHSYYNTAEHMDTVWFSLSTTEDSDNQNENTP